MRLVSYGAQNIIGYATNCYENMYAHNATNVHRHNVEDILTQQMQATATNNYTEDVDALVQYIYS